MLVRLTSSTSGEMVMFAEHAHDLFKQIGKACTARGVFSTEQLADAIACLQRLVEEEKQEARRQAEEPQSAPPAEAEGGEEKAEPCISLAQRAIPLLHLMQWTQKEGGFILWECTQDF